ncbi:YeiH family protein [Desulfallas thermosapovorans]|uniref:Putative integral membrane protein (TIGR00698 family) n=1 Tax=Desulfallas thermosapovorans DSM 6562 TaxID=1121431 RepID=A0A5S4ZNC6_9FIRM|nr:putative sulfate exporter family transporter [Desulfallas thermosapovorans]TYO93372.1 putative integral membrane protein (TIGR00698 family) [Desulfallas thermosapovorans DSM 6562]
MADYTEKSTTGFYPKALRVIPGLLLMFLIAALCMGTKDLGLPRWIGLEGIIKETSHYLGNVLKINYVLLVILIGMVIRNTIGIPSWAVEGVQTSRLFIKIGVILLGTLYSLAEVATLGATSVLLVLSFVFCTIVFVMWLGKRLNMPTSSTACLAAGMGVCGISAIVAVAPVVRGKGEDVAYSIATILTFGLVCMFTFPFLGHLMVLSSEQFGAWAGTGILNSGQVLAAALAFDPGTTETPSVSLKVGEVYNLTRVIFLPLVVLVIALYYSKTAGTLEERGANVQAGSFLSRFPLFVVGFIVTVILTTFGAFGSTEPASEELKMFRVLYSWFFAIGLAGLGLQISFTEMKKAGGQPLIIGTVAGLLKAVGSLIVVLLVID